MKHIIFLDSLDKLTIKKDSTLLLALTLVENGHRVGLLFEDDFYITNQGDLTWKVFDFSGAINKKNFHISNFELKEKQDWLASEVNYFHMRLDPPFDARYLRYLWMQQELERFSMKVVNNPRGVLLFNEKLKAYRTEGALHSFVGASVDQAMEFCERVLKNKQKNEFILKPLDLFQGIGVEKFSFDVEKTRSFVQEKINSYGGAIVVQPYDEKVEAGEVRSIFFAGKEVGTILKVPKKGEFLSNIAQGATYHAVELTTVQRARCQQVSEELIGYGVPWIAFDILGDAISEVNITCPGLLVEVSDGVQKNCAEEIVRMFS